MASHVILDGDTPVIVPPSNILAPAPAINLRGFHWSTVDAKLHPREQHEVSAEEHVPEEPAHSLEARQIEPPTQHRLAADITTPAFRVATPATPATALITPAAPPPPQKQAPPFPLTALQGAFAGNGFNTIWRPRSTNDTVFPKAKLGEMNFKLDDNVLQLSFTTEQLTFGDTIGDIPNRGFVSQDDITLQGLPYLQTIQDVTDPFNGTGANPQATDIHFEPGMWLFVPKNNSTPNHDPPNQDNGPTVVRMASIPHGTTINAQGAAPLVRTQGRPTIDDVNILPFNIGADAKGPPAAADLFTEQTFPAMLMTNGTTLRIPQDLSKFKPAVLTDAIIKNPNIILKNALRDLNILDFVTFEVTTGPPKAKADSGGTANIAFLQGKNTNAHAIFMKSRFWIETVEYSVRVPNLSGGAPALLKPDMPPNSTAPTPWFLVSPPAGKAFVPSQVVKITGTQLQYSQWVSLNFGPLTWPHVSVATLVPKDPQPFTMKP